jgi:hypothetical protein
VFQVDVVEAWLLQPPEEEQQGDATPSGSRGAGRKHGCCWKQIFLGVSALIRTAGLKAVVEQ